MTQAERTGEVFAVPELLRVQGEIARAAGRSEETQSIFHRALTAAKEIESLGWESRINESLAGPRQ